MSDKHFKYDVTVIGAAIADVLVHPVTPDDLHIRSYPAQGISLNIGGDAANEAAALSGLGRKVSLVTKLGDDILGGLLLSHFRKMGVSTEYTVMERGLDTGINIVMISPDAERSFITNSNGSLRKLAPSDISPEALKQAPIVSFASIFVSPFFDVPAMTELFSLVKACGCTLCADMTRAKHGETASELAPALRFVDYLFPNMDEAKAVTGCDTPEAAADVLLECGVSCAVIKTGRSGCYIRTADLGAHIPAYPGTACIDTTGAGDNFAAGFIHALSNGMPVIDCALFANAAASIAVERVGAVSPEVTHENVLERMKVIEAQKKGCEIASLKR